MINLKRFVGITLKLQQRPIMLFANDKWKDRDEAAQKVYISSAEKQTIKKLLKKVQSQAQDRQSNLEQFDRKLNQIMKRYKIQNSTLASQISELHKNLTQ